MSEDEHSPVSLVHVHQCSSCNRFTFAEQFSARDLVRGIFECLFATRHKQFIEPDGPIFFAGDHCSHIIGWHQGAALSAHRALKLICEKVSASKA